MKPGLYVLTVPIILMFYPVAHCFFDPYVIAILNVVRGNQNYLVNLLNSQNAFAAQNTIQVINNGFTQLNARLASIEAKADGLNTQKDCCKNIEGTLAAMEKSIGSISSTLTTNVQTIGPLLNKIGGQVDNIEQTLKRIENKNESYIDEDDMRNKCKGFSAEDNSLQRQVSETDKVLKMYDQKLNTYNNTIGEVTNSLVELKGSLDRIEKARNNNKFNDLTPMNDILSEIKNSLVSTNESIHDGLSQAASTGNYSYNDIVQQLGKLIVELRPLSGNKSVMLPPTNQTDTTNKVILPEIKELIKAQAQQFNETLSNSICKAQPSVIGDQITTLVEKLNKIESDVECLSSDIIDLRNEVTTNYEDLKSN